jgi:hypothetical protein
MRYLWKRSWEIARDQADLEMIGGMLVPRINSVSLWIVDDHVKTGKLYKDQYK